MVWPIQSGKRKPASCTGEGVGLSDVPTIADPKVIIWDCGCSGSQDGLWQFFFSQ